jgi:hypothetical protein
VITRNDFRDRALARAEAQAGYALTPGERAAVVQAAEARLVSAALAAATPPDVCGPEVPVAPARAFRVASFQRLVSAATGRHAPDGHLGRSTVIAADVWDAMERAARERHLPGAAPFVPPFAAHQVAVARIYRAVSERFAAGGVRCASVEARQGAGGPGGPGGVSEALLDDGRWLAAVRLAVGDGVALRPGGRHGRGGRAIGVMALVDLVALRDLTPSAVLRRHDWQPKGSLRGILRDALAGALDRMSSVPSSGLQDVG